MPSQWACPHGSVVFCSLGRKLPGICRWKSDFCWCSQSLMLLQLSSFSTGTLNLITALESTGEQLLFSGLLTHVSLQGLPLLPFKVFGDRGMREASCQHQVRISWSKMYWFILF